MRSELSDRYGVTPALAAIMVGDDAASAQYVRNKRNFAEELGFRSEIIAIPAPRRRTERLLETIARLNADPESPESCCNCRCPTVSTPFALFDAIDAAQGR